MNRYVTAAGGLALTLAAPLAGAEVSDAEFAEVKRMLEQALDRIDELEAERRPASAPTQSLERQVEANTAAIEDAAESGGSDRVQFSGDVRLRHQNDDFAFADGERRRTRLRARVGLKAQATEDLEVGFALASGSEDPVSANQTLGDFGSSKSINLDQAYFTWQATESTDVGGGKFKNDLFLPGKSQMQWDSDWRPEGFNASFEHGAFFAHGIATWLEGEDDERDSADTEQDLLGLILQAGVDTTLGGTDVTVALGYTSFDTAGKPCFDGCGQNASMAGMYMYDYNVLELSVEAGVEVANRPLTFWGHYLTNTDADDEDSGHQVGVQYGEAKKQGTWQTKVFYQELDADAVFAGLTNSNFAGGGTDNKGVVFSGAYALSDQSNFTLTYFATERKNDATTGFAEDRDILQVDLNFKY